jgi:DNA helicase II / ATP-dependent DNA helicase PcrA
VTKRLGVSIDPKRARARISRCKAKAHEAEGLSQQPPSKVVSVDDQEFSQVYREYQNALAASDLLDYDDLLLRCAELLRAHPECVSNVEAVLIDEFQDTNTIQLELMKLLASKKSRVTIVGDPDQSIYGFRSAEIENLARMQRYYPDTSVIHLEENYRSSASVLCAAQEVIEQDTARPNKMLRATHCYGSFPVLRKLPTPHDEAKWIVAEIKRVKALTGNLTTLSDYAILIRSAHLSLLIENALGKAGIPYRMFGGYRFFDREEIRTLLDYLRTISQPNNNAALSAIINVPSRKVGDESLKELLRLADEKRLSLWAVVQKVTQGDLVPMKRLNRPAERNLCKLISLIKEAKKKMVHVSAECTAKSLLEFCIQQLNYKEYLQRKHPEDHENRWANVEELMGQAADVAEGGCYSDGASPEESLPEIEGLERQQVDANDEALASFLANITLCTGLQATEDGREQDCVTISTVHSAKGLEWPMVFIPAVYDGSIPHSRAEDTDEERRLLYVAMTRAQALLYLSCPLRQSRTDTETTLSSFLPKMLHKHFAQLGPDITDKTVRDIASILRRTIPSQEEFVEGMKSLSDRESFQDDLWPADGSPRQRQRWECEEIRPPPKKVKLDVGKHEVTGTLPKYDNDPRADGISIATTMTSSSSFTIAAASFGFSTAARHHELNQCKNRLGVPRCDSRECLNGHGKSASRSTNRNARAATGQASLASFFERGSFASAAGGQRCISLPEPELPSHIDAHAGSAPEGVPVTLAAHKVFTKPASLKRLQPLQDISNVKRKEYLFLSSSPTREEHPEQSLQDYRDPRSEKTGAHEMSHTAAIQSVKTMHTTSMETMQQQGMIGARKTYGVRRMMNGWENRKYN